jgi:predicted DNA-binding transcriptional regulator AlpA
MIVVDMESQPLRSFLTDTQLAEVLGISVAAIRRWRIEGRGPKFTKLGELRNSGVLVRYRAEDVEAWLASLPQGGGREQANQGAN